MKPHPQRKLYEALLNLAPNLEAPRFTQAEIWQANRQPPSKLLTLERLHTAPGRIYCALHKYGRLNGDAMADPDIGITIDTANRRAWPTHYQNDWLGMYREYPTDSAARRDCLEFCLEWIKTARFYAPPA